MRTSAFAGEVLDLLNASGEDGVVVLISMCNRRPDCAGPDWTIVPWKEVVAIDDDFGPLFLKFSSYFPYNAKLCINGHEYLKRQTDQAGHQVRSARRRHPALRGTRRQRNAWPTA